MRKTTVTKGSLSSCDGSAMVKIGNTTVLCGLKLEIGAPSVFKPRDGKLVVKYVARVHFLSSKRLSFCKNFTFYRTPARTPSQFAFDSALLVVLLGWKAVRRGTRKRKQYFSRGFALTVCPFLRRLSVLFFVSENFISFAIPLSITAWLLTKNKRNNGC